jgi:hypothetical protein
MDGVKDTGAFAAYEEFLKHNRIIHTIDLRIRCSPEELKLISERVFSDIVTVASLSGIIALKQEESCKTPTHPQKG